MKQVGVICTQALVVAVDSKRSWPTVHDGCILWLIYHDMVCVMLCTGYLLGCLFFSLISMREYVHYVLIYVCPAQPACASEVHRWLQGSVKFTFWLMFLVVGFRAHSLQQLVRMFALSQA